MSGSDEGVNPGGPGFIVSGAPPPLTQPLTQKIPFEKQVKEIMFTQNKRFARSEILSEQTSCELPLKHF